MRGVRPLGRAEQRKAMAERAPVSASSDRWGAVWAPLGLGALPWTDRRLDAAARGLAEPGAGRARQGRPGTGADEAEDGGGSGAV